VAYGATVARPGNSKTLHTDKAVEENAVSPNHSSCHGDGHVSLALKQTSRLR